MGRYGWQELLSDLRDLDAKTVAQRVLGAIRPDHSSVQESNIWYLKAELYWYGLWAAAIGFSTTFAVRLGATAAQIGWLASVPALISALGAVPVGRFLEKRRNPLHWMLGLALSIRLIYVPLIFIPLFVPSQSQGLVVILVLIANAALNLPLGISFNTLFAEMVPEHRRARVVSARNIISLCMTGPAVFFVGQMLNRARFPFNYQILFALSLIPSLINVAVLTRLRVPQDRSLPAHEQTLGKRGNHLRERLQSLRATFTENPAFTRFCVDMLIYNLAPGIIGPLYILFYVRELGASDAWIGLNTTVATFTAIAGWTIWGRLTERWGEERVLVRASSLQGFYPLLVGITGNLHLILVCALFYHLLAPGVALSSYNTMLKVCPAERRSSYLAIFIALSNTVAIASPLVGIALAGIIGIRAALVAGGVLWLGGASMFRFLPVFGAGTGRNEVGDTSVG